MRKYIYFVNAGPTQHTLHNTQIATSLQAALSGLQSLWGTEINRIIQRKDDVDTLIASDTTAKAFTTFHSKLEAVTRRKSKNMTDEAVMERTLAQFCWNVEHHNDAYRVRWGTTVHATGLDYVSALLYAKTLATVGVRNPREFQAAPSLYPPYTETARWGSAQTYVNVRKRTWKQDFLSRYESNLIIKL